MDATPEEWRPVVGYEGLYEVSDHGRIRTVARLVTSPHRGTFRLKSTVRKPTRTVKGGHLMMQLHRDKKARTVYVHRAVLEAFVGPCPEGQEACHEDDDPTNNHLSNLRWDTRTANLHDRYRNGCVHFNRRKTHCKQGHELSAGNLWKRKDGRRMCRECNLKWGAITRERRRRRRAAAAEKP